MVEGGIAVDRDHLLALIQTDGEFSLILMRAFILRRVELIARGVSDVVVLGSMHCQRTLRVREFLTRNGHPYTFIDLVGEGAIAIVAVHPGTRRVRDTLWRATESAATSPP